MFNFFKKKNVVELKSPIIGDAIEISRVPDEVFSTKMLGDGGAFEPKEGVLYAPIDGEVVQIFPTKHALGLKTKEGIEILLHVGIDTVGMNGQGFESFVNAGDKVHQGQELVKFDIDLINQLAKSTITPLIITNMDLVDSFEFITGNVDKNSVVAKITLK